MHNVILFAEDFSVNPLSSPTTHGTLSGTGADSSWQDDSLTLRIAPGITWRSPSFDVDSLGFVRLSFRARLDPSGPTPTITQSYNKNNLSFVSINPAATWNLDPANPGPSGGDLIADDFTSLLNLSDQWSNQVFYSRAQANAQQMAVSLSGTDAAFFIDDIRIENVSNRGDVAEWADQIWAGRSFSPTLDAPPDIPTNIASEQLKRLTHTLSKLKAGEAVRIVLVGDSIVNDLANSAFDVLLERQFPGASVSVITAVGGGTGMDQWNPQNNTYPFISSSSYNGALNFNDAIIEQQPDLVLLGGISTPGNSSGYAAFQAIIEKLRSQSVLDRLGYQPDIMLATGAFGPLWQNWYPSNELNATRNDYRGNLLRIANQYNTAYIDLTGIWGEYLIASQNATAPAAMISPESRFGYWRDTVHANTFGKQILGRALTAFLSQVDSGGVPAPATTAAITAVKDNVGMLQGKIASGGRTDDTTPTIIGTISAALAAGETVRIYSGDTLLGSAKVNNKDLTWRFTPTLPKSGGTTYSVTARVADAAGNLGAASAARVFTLDTTPPAITAAITAVKDNVGMLQGKIASGGRTDDTTPTIIGTISAALAAGETVRIYSGDTLLGSAKVNNKDLTWRFTPTLPKSGGTTYSVTARVADAAGNLSAASAARTFILDTGVESDVSFVPGPDQSTLRLTGTTHTHGAGNSLDNTIIDNDANNGITGLGSKDILIGGGGSADRDDFMFFQLSDSLLRDPISDTGGYCNEITDFNRNDRIAAHLSIETDLPTALTGKAASIDPASITEVLTTTVFPSDSVVAFRSSSHTGTLIAINDGRAGFQNDTDSIVWLRNYSIIATNFVKIA